MTGQGLKENLWPINWQIRSVMFDNWALFDPWGGLIIYIHFIHFWKKNFWIYIFVTLPLTNKLSPLEVPQICATPLGNSKTKNLRPMENPLNFFLITPRKSTSFLIDSGISACFFQYPLKFNVLNSPYLTFFSGIGW